MTLLAVFVYLSVERLSNEFHGIYCRAKLSLKLLDRLFHRRRQASPISNNITHCLFAGFQQLLCCNLTVGSHHGLSSPLLAESYDKAAALPDLPRGPAVGPVWSQLLLLGSLQKLAGVLSLGSVAVASGTVGMWLNR